MLALIRTSQHLMFTLIVLADGSACGVDAVGIEWSRNDYALH